MAEPSPIAKLAAKPLGFQVAVLIGTMVVLGGIYHQFFYSTLQDDLQSAKRGYDRLEKKTKKLRERETAYKTMVKDKDALDATLNTNQVSLPETAALASFIGHLQRQAAVAGVTFKNWTRQKEEPGKGYVKVPLGISIAGSFHQILKYFYLLGKTKRIITIENFSLSPEKGDNDDVLLKATFRATTFRQADGAVPKKSKPEESKTMLEQGKAAREKRESQVEAVSGGKTDESGNPLPAGSSGLDRLKNPGAEVK